MTEVDPEDPDLHIPPGLRSVGVFALHLGRTLSVKLGLDELSLDASLVEDLGIDSLGTVFVVEGRRLVGTHLDHSDCRFEREVQVTC